MFGKFIGSIISAPVRILNVPVKMTQRAVEAGDRFLGIDDGRKSRRRSRKNLLDNLAEGIEDSCSEAMGDEE